MGLRMNDVKTIEGVHLREIWWQGENDGENARKREKKS